MPARNALATSLLLAGLTAAGPGCVWYGPHSMTRAWCDRNTLNRPAFFVERLSHAPPPRERVEQFRWQYGVGPGMPFVAPDPVVITAPVPTDVPVPPDTAPPAAPPPEPAPGAVEAPRPRPNVAWLFAPARG